jgi:iron complex outermembrane receptor protein
MKKINTSLVVASLCLMSLAKSATLEGQVSRDGIPVPNLKLVISSIKQKTKSNEVGSFVFENVDYGKYVLDIEGANHVHFNTTINFNEGEPVNIQLSTLDYEEVVVTANPLEHNTLKMTTPTAVLSEEDLVMNRGVSLEQTLNSVTGVNSGSFGAGAGQIVIRGQQGPRVTVLNNNIALQDASSVSPDHSITSETLLAKQIEVLKGPATLLYGGGAIGGVVNVLDNSIPSQKIDGIKGGLEMRLSDSALKERAAVLSLQAGVNDRLMTSFNYFTVDTSDYEIPGNTVSDVLNASEGNDAGSLEASGILDHTSVESNGYNLGLSIINVNGYWGISYSDTNRNYGIPGEEQEVRIDMNKSVFNIKGQHEFRNTGFFNQLKTHYSQTNYQHMELEGEAVGTVFNNDANELRFELTHVNIAGFSGVWGVQASGRDFSAIGDEAFIIPTDTRVFSVFMIEEKEFEKWHGELGMRYDNQSISTDLYSDFDDNAFSVSLGATFNLSDNWFLPINWASAQRLPTPEELFSNQSGAFELIPHVATNTIEVGNLDLSHETANNLDIGLKYRNKNVKFNLAAFYNKIDDYIYLGNTGDLIDGIRVFNYQQLGATFKGFETDVSYKYSSKDGFIWNYKLFADATRATLDNGDNVPRIPARRLGLNIGLLKGDWAVNTSYVHVNNQNKLADFELPTQSYNSVDLNINRVFSLDTFDTLVFFKVSNLLNEEIREHASFIKDIAPRPGRSMSAGIRVTF